MAWGLIAASVVAVALISYGFLGGRGDDSSAIANSQATETQTMTGTENSADLVTTATGLQYLDHAVGDGAAPEAGQTVVVHYTGWLYENGEKGAKFDSSHDRNDPLSFALGRGQVISGWDEGLSTMQVGGSRTLIIPPNLAYGDRGAGGVIPGGATLMFDVELVGVQ